MVDKKSVVNFVYAIALVGAIISCFGILNEFFNILQLYETNVAGLAVFNKDNYFIPLTFYLIAFIISAIAITLSILHLFGKVNKKVADIILLSACVIIFIMSFVFVYKVRFTYSYNTSYNHEMSYFDYLAYYTFRSGVMSFVANAGIILVCSLIDGRYKKLQKTAETEEKIETC
ncbi:MAG: hypothetical protein IJF75_05210 [Clostridia bacterium]|nr:hypothetical protein [Clostridia bacterium]